MIILEDMCYALEVSLSGTDLYRRHSEVLQFLHFLHFLF